MKKKISLLIFVLLTLWLMGSAFDRVAVASASSSSNIHAASETHLASRINKPSEQQAERLTLSTQPVVFIVTGLACALFGVLAVTPLLVDDPRLK